MNTLKNLMNAATTKVTHSHNMGSESIHTYPYIYDSESEDEVKVTLRRRDPPLTENSTSRVASRWGWHEGVTESLTDLTSRTTKYITDHAGPHLATIDDQVKSVKMQYQIEKSKNDNKDDYKCGVPLNEIELSTRYEEEEEEDPQNKLIPECQNPQSKFDSFECSDWPSTCGNRCYDHLCEGCRSEHERVMSGIKVERRSRI
ncbi:hypothetical protein L486_01745 [Kwoniella mangroviensis CBS 10435]|uniref:Uncharacterized protein n=1 Tax=Kwoniella mangroviensis CBS 10435 TaxID=1331196 RepID=A0A1B9J2V6_9TREE|nr:hypothetical protein L486_01745 [Kwoniella mangroviensis CBS 10435]